MERKPFTTSIDQTIQDDFKSTCAKNGFSMNEVLEQLMLAYSYGKLSLGIIENDRKENW